MIEQILPSSQGVGALSAEAVALERLLAERHSCRAFLPDEVERGTLESIFTMAQRAASWCNSQPWQVTVLSGVAVRRVRDALLNPSEGPIRESDIPFPLSIKACTSSAAANAVFSSITRLACQEEIPKATSGKRRRTFASSARRMRRLSQRSRVLARTEQWMSAATYRSCSLRCKLIRSALLRKLR